MILLVHPPLTKPCEPSSGLAHLAGALRDEGFQYRLLDANLEGILFLLKIPIEARDTWTRRAHKHIDSNLESLRDIGLYRQFDKYKKTVLEVNRLLDKSAAGNNVRLSLEDYEHAVLSPVKTDDLFYAAQHPEENPFYPYFSERLREIIEQQKPLHIGFSLSYLSQALCTFAMIGFVKKHFPDIQIILGGSLLTSWMKSPAWKNHSELLRAEGVAPVALLPEGATTPSGGRRTAPLIDHLVCGPGERQLLTLLGKEVSQTAHYRPVYDFDNTNQYLAPGLIMPYSTSSGCYWGKCAFCPERAEGNRYIQRSPHVVVSELQSLVEETKPALVHLTDNAVSPAVLKYLTESPPGASWYGFTRVTDHLTDPAFCMALKRSGCVMLKLGVESGDQRVLDAMHKGNDVSVTSRVLKALSQAGIAVYVYLLFGTPAESEKEARITLDFVVEHSGYISFLNLAIFNLPLLSPDSKGLQRSSFYEGDLSLYTDFIHPKGWNRTKVRRFLDGEFKKHPAIKPILQRQPPLFTSNHAPLFSRLFLDSQINDMAK
jgi:radical SAM superfamily enzyme YgiQ (UPF0313 family)